jgi:hypothetical protein
MMPTIINTAKITSPNNTITTEATAPTVLNITIAKMISVISKQIVNIIQYLLPFIKRAVNFAEKEKTQR